LACQPSEQRDERTRTWQLVMTGNGLDRIAPETQAEMARLLDLNPTPYLPSLRPIGRSCDGVAGTHYQRIGQRPIPLTFSWPLCAPLTLKDSAK